MTMELKCCPFCGGEAESDSRRGYRNISTGNPENAAAIYCTKCSADMTWCYRDTPEIERDHVMKLLIEQWNTRATASLQGEDAVERVAHAVTSEFGRMYKDGVPICMREGETTWRTYYAGFDLSQFAQRITDAILATGLASDEAATRADERERCAQIADCMADEFDATSFTSTNADQVAALRSKEQAAHEIAAAIRAGRGEG